MAEVGKRIAERRKELGMSQEELADKLGYSGKSTICKIETGHNDITTSSVAEFAKALNTTIDYLMGWEKTTDEILERRKFEDFMHSLQERPDIMRLINIALASSKEQIESVTTMLEAFGREKVKR